VSGRPIPEGEARRVEAETAEPVSLLSQGEEFPPKGYREVERRSSHQTTVGDDAFARTKGPTWIVPFVICGMAVVLPLAAHVVWRLAEWGWAIGGRW
jgi:hypothetical protein